MNNVAMIVGNMLAATSGEGVAVSPEAPQSTGKGTRTAFADAPPLAKLREELRSHKKPSPGTAPSPEADAAACQPCTTPKDGAISDSSPASTEPRLPSVAVADLTAEELVSLAIVPPADEIAPLPAPAQEGDVAELDAGSDLSLLFSGQQLNVVPQTPSADGPVPTAAQVSAAAEATEAKVLSIPSDVTISQGQDAAQVSATPSVQSEISVGGRDGEAMPPAVAPGAEGPKDAALNVVPVVAEGRTDGSTTGEAKIAMAANETAGTSKPVDSQAAAAQQSRGPLEGQLPTEGARSPDSSGAATTVRVSDTPERSSDGTRQEEGKAFSQQDSAAQQAVVTATPARETPDLKSAEPLPSPIELTVSSETGPAGGSPRLSVQMPSGAGPDAASLRSPVQDIGEQILSSVHASMARADKQVQIRLNPPELGSVLVRIQETNEQVRGIIEVIRDETRREIERALPQVLKGLQDAGVQVRRLEVVVSDQPDRGLGKEQSQQDAWAQQQDSARQGHRPHDTSSHFAGTGRSLGAAHRGHSAAHDSASSIGTGSYDRIDMLV
ncbi:flagellar hook-length control protein FliK [Anaerobaca lacustris]|uniref:Flagellar hook-length control protein FliK n=1 Tax=Anaerobaca lacustris TaxID=3044600 RepID=A0AAW6TR61_9BACT|nr:flagellar hook-length control protein FliK [Sedimentisphaerales bacterium M17dextr]